MPPSDTLPHTLPKWVPPRLERSLSLPPGDSRRDDEGEGKWEDIFGPRADIAFEAVSSELFNGYLEAISKESIMKALLLEGRAEHLSWATEALSDYGSSDDQLDETSSGPGLKRFLQGIRSIPEGKERSEALLTGERRNQNLSLDWTKDSIALDEGWLSAGLDIDSLSLTARDPQFTSPVQFYLYPLEPKLSHIPNFTLAKTGSNNEFRINIFFPQYDKGLNAGRRVITMLNDSDFALWCNEVMLPSLDRVELFCAAEYRHYVTALKQAIPRSYERAKPHGVTGADAFTGFRAVPEVFNLLLFYCRKVVEFFPHLAKFKGFFFPCFGQNLKAIGQEVNRKDGNALLYILKQYPIVDWSLQNPRDIAVDVGLEINVLQEQLPNDLDGLTLLWKLAPLQKLAQHGWQKPHVNSYMHSHVIGGYRQNHEL
ncbi:capsular polysaccharide export protein [Ceratobasidium sp. AG-Ba]|nr:capsular polysaccharide export protein [Ceratobasidium sp. AG-Ba]